MTPFTVSSSPAAALVLDLTSHPTSHNDGDCSIRETKSRGRPYGGRGWRVRLPGLGGARGPGERFAVPGRYPTNSGVDALWGVG